MHPAATNPLLAIMPADCLPVTVPPVTVLEAMVLAETDLPLMAPPTDITPVVSPAAIIPLTYILPVTRGTITARITRE
jgi:hypothetical protein